MIVAEIRKITASTLAAQTHHSVWTHVKPYNFSKRILINNRQFILELEIIPKCFPSAFRFFIVRTFYIYIKPSGTSTVSKRFFLSNLMINSSWAGSKSSSPSLLNGKKDIHRTVIHRYNFAQHHHDSHLPY